MFPSDGPSDQHCKWLPRRNWLGVSPAHRADIFPHYVDLSWSWSYLNSPI